MTQVQCQSLMQSTRATLAVCRQNGLTAWEVSFQKRLASLVQIQERIRLREQKPTHPSVT